jgi:DNA polymerase elongation subunit (family B)
MLVQKLVNKLDVVTQMMEMSNITATPPMYLLQKGQQIKCFSQLSKEAREKGYLIPLAEEREDGKFKGAVVLDPLVGKYDTPVAVLDFASLYPSIQVAYQVCYTTIVMDENLKKKLMQMKENGEPLVVKGVKFDIIEWEEDEYVFRNKDLPCNTCRDEAKRKMSCETCNGLGMKTLHFANEEDAKKMMPKKEIMASIERNDDGEIVTWRIENKKHAYAFAQKQPSLIPDLQVKLKKSRKLVKGMMAPIEHAKDVDSQLRYRVLNGRQLAIKVSMNSLYGFTSAFMMNLQALSAVVTAKGRQMIEQTKEFLENRFESIAKKTLWTLEDEYTFYAPDGKEVVARVEDVSGTPTWIMEFRGKELARSRVGTIPTDDDGKSWIKKYPTAVAGGPWTDHDLDVRVVYGDTDSCFVNFPNSTVAETISLSHKAADLLTDQVFNRAPIEMEYEKTYHPVFIQKKKTYVGIKYEMDDVRWKIDYKGIAVKRRNYCELMKKVLWSVIYPSLGVEAFKNKDGKTELRKVTWDFNLRSKKALESLRVALTELSDGRVEIDDLVISASLKSTYKGPTCTTCDGKKIFTCKRCAGRGCDECRRKGRKDCSTCGGRGVIVNLPHIQLAKRMKERDEGSAPISGQRFGYIVVNDDSRPAELSARTEDPKYAKRNGLKPDYLFYLDQQIRKPVTKFMNLLDENRETEEIFADCQDVLFSKLRSTRMERERQVRQEFFDTSKKRPAPVAALKPPKRPTLSKDQKFKKSVKGMKPILSFFD